MTEFWTKHRVLAVASTALVHFIATVALLVARFSGDRFDRDIPRSLVEEIQADLFYLPTFPLINNPIAHLLPPLPVAVEYGVVILNSLIWGVALVWIAGRWRRASTSG
jgi:hypothetical protein